VISKRALAVIVGTVAIAVVFPATSLGAPAWTAPAPFPLPSTDTTATDTSIAYQSGGIATIAYPQIISVSPTISTVVHVGVIAPGGGYTEQLTIPSSTGRYPDEVSLAVAPDGAAVLEYSDTGGIQTGAPAYYYVSYRPKGSSTWGAPVQIATDAVTDSPEATDLMTAIAPDGTAAAGIDHVDPAIASPYGNRIDVAVVSPAGTWGTPTQVSPTADDSENATMAFDSADNLTVAFSLSESDTSTGRMEVNVETRSGSVGVWGSPVQIGGDNTSYAVSSPRLAVGSDGSAALSFQYDTAGTIDTWAATRAGAAGAWTALADVTAGSSSAAPLAVGVSPSDEAYVIYTYQGTNSGKNCIGAARVVAGDSFPAGACASALNYQDAGAQGIAFDGNDAYWAMTGQPNAGGQTDIEVDRWQSGSSTPDTPTTIVAASTTGADLTAIASDQDSGVPVFYEPANASSLSVSAYDAGGPLLTAASVPTTAVAGQPVTLSASFTDLWSPPTSAPTWAFGDSTTGNGASVTHSYAAAGTYTVDATSTDALGNATTVPFTITVGNAPAQTTTTTTTTTTTKVPTKLSGFAQTAARWQEKKPRHAKGKQPPVGTHFRFTLSRAARVTLTITGSTAGRKVRGKCVAATSRNRHDKACSLHLSRTISIAGKSGANTVSFAGKIPGHGTLALGRYRVTIAPAGGPVSGASSLSFTIVA
jgi:hypothetical protein